MTTSRLQFGQALVVILVSPDPIAVFAKLETAKPSLFGKLIHQ
jgi:hypothetical protein